MTDKDWISTGAAARALGYSVSYFRRKFLVAFQAQHAVICQPDGHWRWSRSLVDHLAHPSTTSQAS